MRSPRSRSAPLIGEGQSRPAASLAGDRGRSDGWSGGAAHGQPHGRPRPPAADPEARWRSAAATSVRRSWLRSWARPGSANHGWSTSSCVGSAPQATVIRGHCLPYGDAISYWPLAEALRAAAGIQPDDSPETALERLRALAAGLPQAQLLTERVAAAIGLGPADGSAPVGGSGDLLGLPQTVRRHGPAPSAGGSLRRRALGHAHVPRPRSSTSSTRRATLPSCCWLSGGRSCSRHGQAGATASERHRPRARASRRCLGRSDAQQPRRSSAARRAEADDRGGR